ncbi:type VI secretion system Vgr family protein [Marimonas sp. MJW-29]|uniref:Type VI secretion system Vgr family protein n=1 Tax=Sulfitobacter sediminis TaxID=3234186 RepID=A0ABV3RT18_9RHOB
MTVSKPRKDASTWMSGTYTTDKLRLKRGIVKEKLSTLTETTIEFLAQKTEVKLSDFVGKIMTLHVQQEGSDNGRMFTGTCISVEAMGMRDQQDHFVAHVRPWFWMLTVAHNTRVFQDKTVIEIIEEVLGDHGFSDYEVKTSETYPTREYCVQYRETDFAFLSRLMEEEGIYYFFDYTEAMERNEKLIICDGVTAHRDLSNAEIKFKPKDGSDKKSEESIGEWAAAQSVTRGKVSLVDYDFETPSVRQLETTEMRTGSHNHNGYEWYDKPGHYRGDADLGKTRSRVRVEADAIRHVTSRGAGNARDFGTGFLFKLIEHPEELNNVEYLITECVHYVQDSEEQSESEMWFAVEPENIEFPEEVKDDYSFVFGVVPKSNQYRAPFVTPWPNVPGIQIGEVVGPEGKEIYTDKYGRIKIRFRWDRVNLANESASCWIRYVSHWSGNNWGFMSFPRVGQEVLVMFEDGDPDRPICTGMMYNADKMPPFEVETEETRTGLVTRSSPGGSATTFNSLMFEDDIGNEYVHFQSQKDYQMVVKDSAQITIGDDGVNVSPEAHDVDPGSLLQTVKQHVTEIVQEGNKSETVDQGTLDLTVEGDRTEVVRTGAMTLDISSSSLDVTAATTILIEAQQSITLKVGETQIELTQTGITISAPLSVEAKALNTTVKGEAMLTLNGGLTKIN